MSESLQQLAVATKRLEILRRYEAFDPDDLDSRHTDAQLDVSRDITVVPHRYVAGGNQSGKSIWGGRELSWLILDQHPFFSRRDRWGTEALTVLVLGITTTQIEEVLWDKKLKPFFTPGTYREIRTGGVLSRVKFDNGDSIIFISHHAPSDARDKAQSYVAHIVWLDELCDSIRMIEELHRRVTSKNGLFFATFTPKFKNEAIRKLIDTPTTVHKKYSLDVLDNPIYAEGTPQREQFFETTKTYSPEYVSMLRKGTWFLGDLAVYKFDPEANIKRLPVRYSHLWRHVASVDPAASGKSGLTVWAEDPVRGEWYLVKAKYILGCAGSILVQKVEDEIDGYNIVKRIYDPHETWFAKEATLQKIKYCGVMNKNNRKNDLIKGVQEGFLKHKIFVTAVCELFITEVTSCQWHESVADKIIGASKYHLLDSAQYAVDNFPKFTGDTIVAKDCVEAFHMQLKAGDKKRREKEAKKRERIRIKKRGRRAWR